MFSVTKAVTAVALHIQAERGLVDYAMPIAHYWAEFGAHGKDKATVYDALTHRLGVPIMPLGVTPELMCDWDWIVQRIADMHPLFEPGTKAAYMSYTFAPLSGELIPCPSNWSAPKSEPRLAVGEGTSAANRLRAPDKRAQERQEP